MMEHYVEHFIDEMTIISELFKLTMLELNKQN